MGSNHCSLLSHYWWFINTPYPTLADLDEIYYTLLTASIFSIQASLLPPKHCSLNHIVPLYWLCANALYTCIAPSLPQKEEEKTPLAWFCHFRDQLFSPSIQCQTCEKMYASTSIFSAALWFLTSYLLVSRITKTLQLFSQRSYITRFFHCLYSWTL